MSSYLDKTGLERVWSKAKDKFATVATTDELKGNIEILTSEKADKTEVQAAVANLIDSAPDTLNTLNELAAALGDNPNFATTVSAEIGKKVNSSEYNDTIGSINSQISAINEEIDSLQEASEQHLNKIDYLGPVVMEGNPVTYDNGVEGFDIRVETTFSPKQEGSGDPYPAGGGRNKLVPNVNYGTQRGLEFTRNADGSWTVKGTTTAANAFLNLNYVNGTTSLLPPGEYIVSGGSADVRVQIMLDNYATWQSDGNHVRFTIPNGVTNSWVRLQVESASVTVDRTVYPMVRLATDTDESYAPPSNIRPITGYDAVELNHAGKNLMPVLSASDSNSDGVEWKNNRDGSWTANGTATAAAYITGAGKAFGLGVLPAGEYKLNIVASSEETGKVYLRIGSGQDAAFLASNDSQSKDKECTFVADGVTEYYAAIAIKSGETVKDYRIFPVLVDSSHSVCSINFGQTVYGGKFDWLTGKLVAEWAMVTLTGEDGAKMTGQSGKRPQVFGFDDAANIAKPGHSGIVADAKSSHFKAVSWNELTGGNDFDVFAVNDGSGSIGFAYNGTIDEANAWLQSENAAGTPFQTVYKLATPIEIQLTPTQISELEGINTLYGDGDSIRAIFKSTGGTSTTLETISGTLPVEKGGTGATSAAGARSNLGITPANIGALSTNGGALQGSLAINCGTDPLSYYANRTIDGVTYEMQQTIWKSPNGIAIRLTDSTNASNKTLLNALYLSETETSLAKPLNVASGGTGATTAAQARTNLGITPANIGAAPTSHASTATTYGAASASNYGHAMASSTTPKANGTAAIGSETAKFARGDHVHPLQTSVSGSSGSCTGNAATATALTTSAGSSTRPIYFSSGKPVQVDNVYIGSSTDATSRSFDVKRKNSSDASYGRLNIGLSSTGNAAFIDFLHYDTSGTKDQENLLYIAGNSLYPNTADSINLGTSTKTWGTVYATSFSGSGASLTSLNASNISSGTLALARGGTGITSNPSMLVNLGSTSAASVFAASPRPGITGTLGVGNGGTGATSKSGARTNLGITSGTSLPASATSGDIFFLYS